jgi:serine protease AprX
MRRALSFVCLVILSLVLADSSYAQDEYRVFFRDKGLLEHDLTPGSERFEETLSRFSSKAIERRKRNLSVDHDWQTIDEADFAVSESYLTALASHGAEILNTSRWLNFASVRCSEAAIERIRSFGFVKQVQKLAPARPQTDRHLLNEECGADTIVFHRGLATDQLNWINTTPLHWLGIDATGVTIAYFDTGFWWKDSRALKHLNVIAEYDFVFQDSVTQDQQEDLPIPNTHGHGTVVLGAAAAFLPDTVIGPAFNANFILGKTEDLRSETPREEENYAAGLEWAEALGADIASVSLGYIDFDSGFTSYTYPDLDGKTAISSRAAAKAAQLGMLIVVANGNDGAQPFPYMNPPADADSILAVGAMAWNDTIAAFSSRGPTADGRIKPDIVAPGVGVWTYHPAAGPLPQTGTSLAAPLVSSSAALIMQAHPEAHAQDIRRAIMETGDNSSTPDTAEGWGMLNAYAAALRLGPFIGRFTQSFTNNELKYCLGYASEAQTKTVRLTYMQGGVTNVAEIPQSSDSLFYEWSRVFAGMPGDTIKYFIEAISGEDTIRLPQDAPTVTYAVKLGDTSIVFADVREQKAFASATVYPNPASEFVEVASKSPIASLDLIDATGRVLLTSISTTELSKRIVIRELAAGSYVLRVVYKNGEQEVLPLRIVR